MAASHFSGARASHELDLQALRRVPPRRALFMKINNVITSIPEREKASRLFATAQLDDEQSNGDNVEDDSHNDIEQLGELW